MFTGGKWRNRRKWRKLWICITFDSDRKKDLVIWRSLKSSFAFGKAPDIAKVTNAHYGTAGGNCAGGFAHRGVDGASMRAQTLVAQYMTDNGPSNEGDESNEGKGSVAESTGLKPKRFQGQSCFQVCALRFNNLFR